MTDSYIQGRDISFTYYEDGNTSPALDGLDIDIGKGEFIVFLGQNGSGKSTLAKLLNALLPLQKGVLNVADIDAGDEKETWKLRRLCGMVFQNPDNQFVSSLVEEDVAFGLENYNVPRNEIPLKVAAALKLVGMEAYEKRSPQKLSGGQKQRVALAGVLALEPEIIIFDEVTAMLDPEGRREVLKIIKNLHRDEKNTIIMITHFVEEALSADRIFLMHKGRIIGSGKPRDVLTDIDMMNSAGLLPPIPVRLYYDLKTAGIVLKSCPLNNVEFVEEVCRLA